MKKSNLILFVLLIIAIIIPINIYIGKYISSVYYKRHNEESAYLPVLASEKVDDPEKFDYIDKYESVEDAKEYIGLEPLKEYKSDGDIYLLVFEGWEAKDDLVCYRYETDTKELYRVVAENSILGTLYYKNICDSDWYDENIIFDITCSSAGSNHFIPQGSSENGDIGDVYYGLWFGDEVKNISFEKGKFEYTLIEGYSRNAYLCTYELQDSVELLNQAITSDGRDLYYNEKTVKTLLGVKCKYTFDKRIVIYLIVTCILLLLTILSIVKAVMLNQKVSGVSIPQILFWLLSIVLCVVVTFLIINFIYNPRLVFGLQTTRLVEKLIGITLPNNPETL